MRFPTTPKGSAPNRWITVVQVAHEQVRDGVLDSLARKDIKARPTWKPMHVQPVYGNHRMFGAEVSEAAFASGICLPSGTAMAGTDQDRVLAALAARTTSEPATEGSGNGDDYSRAAR